MATIHELFLLHGVARRPGDRGQRGVLRSVQAVPAREAKSVRSPTHGWHPSQRWRTDAVSDTPSSQRLPVSPTAAPCLLKTENLKYIDHIIQYNDFPIYLLGYAF